MESKSATCSGPPQLKAVQFDMPANLTEPPPAAISTHSTYSVRYDEYSLSMNA